MSELGRLVVVAGVVVVVIGLLLMIGSRIPFLGRLPGDLSFTRGNTHFYMPLATGLLLSVVLSVVLNLLFRR